MTIAFTNHAVERFLQFHQLDDRTDPRDATQVRAMLEEAATRAVKLPEKTRRGHTQWQLQELGIEIVTKHDNGVDVCVTILPPPRLRGLDPRTAELVEIKIQQIEARRTAIDVDRAFAADEHSKIPPGADAKMHQAKAATRLTELRAEAALLTAEADVLRPILKAIRTALHFDAQEIPLKRLRKAFNIAKEFLRRLPPEQTKDVFYQIWHVDPDLVGGISVDDDTGGNDGT